ncbi:MAG: hypothetical protein KAX18_14865, partial [Candidatus Lokiarchaeota archaeon]|nr:hypothetical protein [Candidatus Lokiarchaeota archaeon]
LDRPFKAPFFPYLPILVGSSCLILAFALNPNPNAVILGVIIFVIGITYYLLTIADRHSIVFTIAGLKTIAIIVVGVFIWILNNLGRINSPIQGFTTIFSLGLMRILIVICIFIIGTIFLDIIPLKELVYFFIKKVSKKEVAINIGVGRIIELKKSKLKLIYNVNRIIGFIQIASSLFAFSLIALITFDIISIENIIFGSIIIPEKTGEFLFVSLLIFFGTILIFSGPLSLYINRETKSLGI